MAKQPMLKFVSTERNMPQKREAEARRADFDEIYAEFAKAKAEELQYMTEERFAQVKKGMSTEEVRELLGTPKRNNQREFDGDVTGLFYPKQDPPKSAAGVFFQVKNDELTVYKTDFDAVQAPTQEG